MFKQFRIILMFIFFILFTFPPKKSEDSIFIFHQEKLVKNFIEVSNDIVKIERLEDNPNVHRIALEIVKLGKNTEKYNFFVMYNKLNSVKKISKKTKEKFHEMSKIISQMD